MSKLHETEFQFTHHIIESPPPLNCDSFVARSALQKAIRRDDEAIALAAAATVLDTAPSAFWRRLIVTAIEDVGIGERDLLAKMISAERLVRRNGQPDYNRAIAFDLVLQACNARKCQAANELSVLSRFDVDMEDDRRQCPFLTGHQLLDIALDQSQDIRKRGVAVMAIIGTTQVPRSRHADSKTVLSLFQRLIEQSGGEPYAHCYLDAFRITRAPIAATSLMLLPLERKFAQIPEDLIDDPLPFVECYRRVPNYSIDQHTRVGKRAIGRFIVQSKKWQEFAKSRAISRNEQIQAVGELLFRLEGAAVIKRRHWKAGVAIHERARSQGCYVNSRDVDEARALIFAELPLLNHLRANLI